MEQILNEIRVLVERRLGDGCKVSLVNQLKNNRTEVQSLMITDGIAPEISPVVRADSCAEAVCGGNMTAAQAADFIVEQYRTARRVPVPDMGFVLSDKQEFLSRVTYRLINAKMNSEILSKAPHKDFLDLSAEYRIVFSDSRKEAISARVSGDVCGILGIAAEELDEAAKRNTYAAGFENESLTEFVARLEGLPAIPSADDELFPVRVFTSRSRAFGASVMLYPQEFYGFAKEYGDDLYILPSSVHEVLALPCMGLSKNELRSAVKEVNAFGLEDDEVLSESVYRYSLLSGGITIA